MDTAGLATVIVAMTVQGLGSPANILGGLVLGWFCRRWWQVVPAAVALHAVILGVVLPGSLPAGAGIAWALLPPGVIGPLAWCAAGFVLRRQVVTPGGGAERAGTAIAAGLAGGILGGALGAAGGSLYVEAARVSSFEGQAGYLVVFGFVLPGVLAGAVLGAAAGWRRARR